MKYRSRAEINTEILAIASGGAVTRTRIMFKSFLSHIQAKEYLTTLTERGLLRYDEETQTYRTTERGLRVLQAYKELRELTKGIAINEVTTTHVVSELN
jgi:predicted transcriptional regulator